MNNNLSIPEFNFKLPTLLITPNENDNKIKDLERIVEELKNNLKNQQEEILDLKNIIKKKEEIIEEKNSLIIDQAERINKLSKPIDVEQVTVERSPNRSNNRSSVIDKHLEQDNRFRPIQKKNRNKNFGRTKVSKYVEVIKDYEFSKLAKDEEDLITKTRFRILALFKNNGCASTTGKIVGLGRSAITKWLQTTENTGNIRHLKKHSNTPKYIKLYQQYADNLDEYYRDNNNNSNSNNNNNNN